MGKFRSNPDKDWRIIYSRMVFLGVGGVGNRVMGIEGTCDVHWVLYVTILEHYIKNW